mgnify:CR=1 FL=1
MSDYNQKYNKDDVYIRSMIVCLLAELNKKMYYYNRIDGELEKVSVPCLYAITGGERFLRDEFYYDALEMGKAIGDYEKVPRCVVNLNGVTVNSGEQTNKYNRTKIVKPIYNQLRVMYLNVEYVPITLNFDCKVICSNNIELFKITETIISKIYRHPNYFKVDFGMFNVDGAFSVPTDYSHERPQEFGLSDKKEYSTSFNIEMKSYLPAFEGGILFEEIESKVEEYIKEVYDENGGNKGPIIIEINPDPNNPTPRPTIQNGGIFLTITSSEYSVPTTDETQILNSTLTHKSQSDISIDEKDFKDRWMYIRVVTKQKKYEDDDWYQHNHQS